jgi:hypothetical protein
LVPVAWFFCFSKKYFLLYGRFQGSHLFVSYLFCLLKSC